jgi:hypothetical protein
VTAFLRALILHHKADLEYCNLLAVALQVTPGKALRATIYETGRYTHSGLLAEAKLPVLLR